MGTFRATSLATPNHLLTHVDLGLRTGFDGAISLQMGAGEDLEATQPVFVEISHRVEKIAVERHQAT